MGAGSQHGGPLRRGGEAVQVFRRAIRDCVCHGHAGSSLPAITSHTSIPVISTPGGGTTRQRRRQRLPGACLGLSRLAPLPVLVGLSRSCPYPPLMLRPC